jgi:hypothetical protein
MAASPVPRSTTLVGSGTGLWNMNPYVVTEPLMLTVSVPAVGCRKVGKVKLAGKKHPVEVVHE